jgi:hypothetical protein
MHHPVEYRWALTTENAYSGSSSKLEALICVVKDSGKLSGSLAHEHVLTHGFSECRKMCLVKSESLSSLSFISKLGFPSYEAITSALMQLYSLAEASSTSPCCV